MSEPRLAIRALHKAFGANPVLQGLELAIAPGEIHGLVGGNGAGKSTLSKIIAGLGARDAGEIRVDGALFAPASRAAAQAAGVVMVLQELSVLPTLSVSENLFLDNLPARRGILDRTRLNTQARAALARVGLDRLDPDMPAGSLGVGHQQLIEIAAALAKDCRLLILDEPTAALSSTEITTLFGLLAGLRSSGTSILYITHRLEELGRLADRISVLRDGRLVATRPAATGREELIRLMAGGSQFPASEVTSTLGSTETRLRVVNLRAGRAVRGVSLTVGRGEIVGLGGLVGAGRTELLRAIYGADPVTSGCIFLGGEVVPFQTGSPRESVARGLAFVPEDRKQHGIFGPRALRFNTSLTWLPECRGLPGWVDRAKEQTEVTLLLDRLQVRHAGMEQPISQLSGGNQQKLVIGRWLGCDTRLWLLDEPTRGVDATAREGIYALLRSLAAEGAGVLVASSDYEELVGLCHRILVMSTGVVTAEFTRQTISPEAFTAASFGGFAPTGSVNN